MSTTTTSRKCVEGCRCGRHRKRTPTERKKLATALRGQTRSPETRARIAAARRQKIENDPAERLHMRRIARERWERERRQRLKCRLLSTTVRSDSEGTGEGGRP